MSDVPSLEDSHTAHALPVTGRRPPPARELGLLLDLPPAAQALLPGYERPVMSPEERFLFELRVNDLLLPWLDPSTSNPEFEPLMDLLGCNYITYRHGYVLASPVRPPAECDSAVWAALLKLMHQGKPAIRQPAE